MNVGFCERIGIKKHSRCKTVLVRFLIKEQVTAEQIDLLSAEIDFDRETELVYSGIQMGLDGSAFTILQFKYSDDKDSPPKEIVKVIFDEDNLIVGVQPMKMQN